MPENLAIGAFVLGSVLLLVSLLSGGFKLFGAEVSGTTGRIGRIIAFVLGLVFIVTGFSVSSSAPVKVGRDPIALVADTSSVQPDSPQPVVKPLPTKVVNSRKPVAAPEPASDSVATVDLSWRDGTPELQQMFALYPQQLAVLGYAALQSGMDVYAFHVKFTNSGDGPVMISPEKIRIHYGLETVPATTLNMGEFLHAGRLQPDQSREGIVAFSARVDIGAAIRLGGGNLTYEDDAVEVTYNGK